MPFVLIQFLPTRPSLGLQEISDRQGETALRFRLRLTGLKRSAPSCKHGSHPFFNPAPCLPQVLDSPPSQLAVGNCMHSEWHLDIEKPLFHLYKNPVQCGKQRTPVSPESQPQYCKCARDGTAFCHNLSDAVRQRFAAYYPGRKTQRERSATTGSAGVMRILSCCSHNQPAEVEEKSFLPAFFYGIYSVANLVCFHILRFSQNHSRISTNPHSPTSPHMPQRNAA